MVQSMQDVNYYLDCWLREVATSDDTREAYTRDLRAFLAAVDTPFDQVQSVHLQQYRLSINHYSVATRQRKIAAIRSFYQYLNDLELVDLNLARFKGPTSKRQIAEDKLLTEAEILAIIDAAKPDAAAYLFTRFLYLTGCRVSESLSARWRDLTPIADRGEIVLFGKGGKWRRVPIPAELWADLIAARGTADDADRVFAAIADRHDAAYLIGKLAKAARVDKHVTPHSFRHACASHLIAKGANVAAVRDLLGHSSISTTNLYAHTGNVPDLGAMLTVR